jgi:methionyl-tRNA formyltransferase
MGSGEQRARVVFMGTADLAAECLRHLLLGDGYEVVGVVTQPDRPRGRSMRLLPGPVKELAGERGLEVLQPERARESGFLDQLAGWRPDIIVVAAYGQILPKALLELPRFGCVNVHTSLLPRYRGAAPIQWAIANGDTETGVTLMRVVEELDAGDILVQRSTPIGPRETGQELHDRLAVMGGEMLRDYMPQILRGELSGVPQSAEGVTYARKITRQDGRVDWGLDVRVVYDRFRAFQPWPGGMTWVSGEGDPWLLKICAVELAEGAGEPGEVIGVFPDRLRVACGSGALDLLDVQREGGRRLPVGDFLRGVRIEQGMRLVTLS